MSTFTGQTKSSTPMWTPASKSLVFGFILLENGFYMLLENAGKIILEQSGTPVSWTAQTKSP